VKALSLYQPWASLVALGAKRFETRSWRTSYRGPLLVCASKTFPREAQQLATTPPFATALRAGATKDHRGFGYTTRLPTGAAVAVAELVRCLPTEAAVVAWSVYEDGAAERYAEEIEFGDYAPGRWAWELRNVRRLAEPVPCRGAMGLWDVPADVLAKVNAGLLEAAP
jgi:hypothetical protein